jgi:hypothetical protein
MGQAQPSKPSVAIFASYAAAVASPVTRAGLMLSQGRLHCMTVFVLDGVVKKFNPDGSLAGDLTKFEDGRTF